MDIISTGSCSCTCAVSGMDIGTGLFNRKRDFAGTYEISGNCDRGTCCICVGRKVGCGTVIHGARGGNAEFGDSFAGTGSCRWSRLARSFAQQPMPPLRECGVGWRLFRRNQRKREAERRQETAGIRGTEMIILSDLPKLCMWMVYPGKIKTSSSHIINQRSLCGRCGAVRDGLPLYLVDRRS